MLRGIAFVPACPLDTLNVDVLRHTDHLCRLPSKWIRRLLMIWHCCCASARCTSSFTILPTLSCLYLSIYAQCEAALPVVSKKNPFQGCCTPRWIPTEKLTDRQQPWPFVKYNAANNTACSCWSSSNLYRKWSLFSRLPPGCRNMEETQSCLCREPGEEWGKYFSLQCEKSNNHTLMGFWPQHNLITETSRTGRQGPDFQT